MLSRERQNGPKPTENNNAFFKFANWLLSTDIDDLQQSLREDKINKTQEVALQVFYKYKSTLKKLLQKEDSVTFHTEHLKTLVAKIITGKK